VRSNPHHAPEGPKADRSRIASAVWKKEWIVWSSNRRGVDRLCVVERWEEFRDDLRYPRVLPRLPFRRCQEHRQRPRRWWLRQPRQVAPMVKLAVWRQSRRIWPRSLLRLRFQLACLPQAPKSLRCRRYLLSQPCQRLLQRPRQPRVVVQQGSDRSLVRSNGQFALMLSKRKPGPRDHRGTGFSRFVAGALSARKGS
jgi:hypothetical protein